jgi:predicted Fe-S protein YdhL (DUF1289 family)
MNVPPPVPNPPSPCVGICKLDENLVCTGCDRTIEEITNHPERVVL